MSVSGAELDGFDQQEDHGDDEVAAQRPHGGGAAPGPLGRPYRARDGIRHVYRVPGPAGAGTGRRRLVGPTAPAARVASGTPNRARVKTVTLTAGKMVVMTRKSESARSLS